MASAPQILELLKVCKDYDAVDAAQPLKILKDIDLSITAGESLAIVGPSGSGKSTLLNIMGTLDQPTSGQVKLDGQELNGLDEKQLAAVRNQQIGFIFQLHHLLPHCTALENVLAPSLATPDKTRRHEAEKRGRQLLERVGLGNRMGHFPGQLSGGERQRVAVVRALINQPKVVLADEPTGALDRTAAHELSRLLAQLNREEKVTLVLVTHALDLAAQMQRVLELSEGRLVPSAPRKNS